MSSQPIRFGRRHVPSVYSSSEIEIGHLLSLDSDGRPLVSFEGSPSKGAVALVATPEVPPDVDVRQRPKVLLTFENTDRRQPIIIGFVRETFVRSGAGQAVALIAEDTRTIQLNGKAVIFQADEEIVLRCGFGSLIIRADGQIVIKGKKLVSRASETNKIRGASVQIN